MVLKEISIKAVKIFTYSVVAILAGTLVISGIVIVVEKIVY